VHLDTRSPGRVTAAQGFLDLTKLVTSDGGAKRSAFDDLAYSIGRDVYADLNGWHLLLKDMSALPGGPKVNAVLADKLGSLVRANGREAREGWNAGCQVGGM